MHIIFRETHGLEETETPFDLGQDPAEIVVLSFSDSDLGAFASGADPNFSRREDIGYAIDAPAKIDLVLVVVLSLSQVFYVDLVDAVSLEELLKLFYIGNAHENE